MRHTQYRIHAEECVPGLISISLAKVDYDGPKIAGHDIVLMDWCEPGQLEGIAAVFLSELAAASYRRPSEHHPQLPL